MFIHYVIIITLYFKFKQVLVLITLFMNNTTFYFDSKIHFFCHRIIIYRCLLLLLSFSFQNINLLTKQTIITMTTTTMTTNRLVERKKKKLTPDDNEKKQKTKDKRKEKKIQLSILNFSQTHNYYNTCGMF